MDMTKGTLSFKRRKGEKLHIDQYVLVVKQVTKQGILVQLIRGGKSTLFGMPFGSSHTLPDLQVEITLVSIHAVRQVRMVVKAPRTVPIWRHEVWLRIQQEKKEALCA